MGEDAPDGPAADAVAVAPAPAGTPGGTAALELPPHLASIGRGRRWVAADAVRHGLPDTGVRIVQLLASELIANAVLHGPPGGGVRVRVVRSRDTFRVEVDDASAALPRLLPVTRDEGGRGLTLVDRLADRWGYQGREPDGKTVWFEVRVRRSSSGSVPATTPSRG